MRRPSLPKLEEKSVAFAVNPRQGETPCIRRTARRGRHSPVASVQSSRWDVVIFLAIPGTSCLATIVLSLWDRNHSPIEAPRILGSDRFLRAMPPKIFRIAPSRTCEIMLNSGETTQWPQRKAPSKRELIEPNKGDKRYVRRKADGTFGKTVDPCI
jgi:hypothetical protein